MTVVVDATGTKLITTVAGASVNYTGITVGTGVNRALVVTVACAAAVTSPNAHWDTAGANQAMTLISVVKTQTNVTTFMFGLRNPVSGNKTLNVAWTTSAKSNVEAISFTGVEQASDARAFTLNNFASDGGTANSITMGITPPTDAIAVASYGTTATFSTLNQTNLFTDITNTGCEGGATRANGAGSSILFTGTDTTTAGNKVIVGFAIVSDSAPPTVPWEIPVWPKKGLAAHLQSFIVAEPVGPPKEDIPKVDRWLASWPEPVRRLPPAIQTLPTWSGFTPATASTSVVASDDGSAGPTFRKRVIYRVKTEPVFVPPDVTYTATQWPERLAAKPGLLNYYPTALVLPIQPTVWSQSPPWPDPIRQRPAADFKPWSFIPTPAQVFFSYAPWDDFARRNRALPDTQPLAWSGFTPASVTFVASSWPDFAPRAKRVDFTSWSFIPTPAQVFFPYAPWDFARGKPRPLDTQPLAWSTFTPAATAQVFFAYGPWDDFTRRKQPALDTQPLAWAGFTPVPVVSTDVVASDDGSAGPRFRWRLIYRTKTEPVFVPPAAFTYSQLTSWPDIIPTRQRPVTTQPLAWSTFTPAAQVLFSYAPWDDFARRNRPPLNTQSLAWSGFTPASTMDWFGPLADPVRRPIIPRVNLFPAVAGSRSTAAFFTYPPWDDFARRKQPPLDTQPLAWSGFTPIVVQVFFPYAPWDDFTRRKAPPLDTQPLAWSGFTPTPAVSTDIVASDNGSAGPSFRWRLIYRTKTEPVLVPAAAFTYSQLTSWPDIIPIRRKPVVDFTPWTFIPAPAQVFFPYAPWDDFAKKPAFAAWQQQALAWSAFTPPAVFFLPERWSDFATKKKPPLNYEPLAFLQVIRSPFNSFVNWPDFARGPRRPLNYEPLALLQTTRTPWVTMTTWPEFARLERKPGLGAPYQQFTARFVGTSTATTITVSMSALEVNSDTANAVVRVIQSQPAASALVSIEETGILIDPLPGSA